jgi:hypothetical protein
VTVAIVLAAAMTLTAVLARTPLAVPLTGRARVPWRRAGHQPQPLPPPVPAAADAEPGETAQRARTGILVRAVSLRANAGPETSHG